MLAGDGPLADAVVDGPAGVRILPGAHAMRTLPEVLGDGPARLAAELRGLEAGADLLIVDAGSGLGPGIATLAAAADEVVVVTTPEPTSVADAHAAIGRFRRLPGRPAPGGGQPGGLGRRGGRRPGAALRRRAGSSSARSSPRWGTSGPTRTCRWPSGRGGRSCWRTRTRSRRGASAGWPATWSPSAGPRADGPASSPHWRRAGP